MQLPQVMFAAACAVVWIRGPMTDVRQRSQTGRPVREACDEWVVWMLVKADAMSPCRRLLDGRGCGGRTRAWEQGEGREGRSSSHSRQGWLLGGREAESSKRGPSGVSACFARSLARSAEA